MLDAGYVDREIVAYRLKLAALHARYVAGERSTLAPEMFTLREEITCLRDDAPSRKQGKVGTLLKHYDRLYERVVS